MSSKFQESLISALFSNNPDAVVYFDTDTNICNINEQFTALFGYQIHEVIGKNLNQILDPNSIETDYLSEQILQGESVSSQRVRYDKKGKPIPVIVRGIPLILEEEVIGGYGIYIDISEQKQLERSNYYLAYNDPLTSLPNRISFINDLNKFIDEGIKKNDRLAILMIDLDRFKTINDSLGHDFGDLILQGMAERLQDLVYETTGELNRVYRLGGDEYTILLRNGDLAKIMAQKIAEASDEPIEIIDKRLFITVSIGISYYPNDGVDCNMLLRNADTAMYEAKKKGRSQYVFYESSMNERAIEWLELENDLRQALKREELELFYQPQIRLDAQEAYGLEALLRWFHVEKGMISPATFIPLAEETGLIIDIGKWVLEQACLDMKKLLQQKSPIRKVAVNISMRQFMHKGFTNTVKSAITAADIEPHHLELEVTESVAMKDVKIVVDVLNELQELGVSTSIDDFGTGYSSLSNFRNLPINSLKIDQSFISRLNKDPKDEAIVKTIINMAHSLHMNVIAEGVETEEQLESLRTLGCDAFQGYLFSRPKAFSDIIFNWEQARKSNEAT